MKAFGRIIRLMEEEPSDLKVEIFTKEKLQMIKHRALGSIRRQTELSMLAIMTRMCGMDSGTRGGTMEIGFVASGRMP